MKRIDQTPRSVCSRLGTLFSGGQAKRRATFVGQPCSLIDVTTTRSFKRRETSRTCQCRGLVGFSTVSGILRPAKSRRIIKRSIVAEAATSVHPSAILPSVTTRFPTGDLKFGMRRRGIRRNLNPRLLPRELTTRGTCTPASNPRLASCSLTAVAFCRLEAPSNLERQVETI